MHAPIYLLVQEGLSQSLRNTFAKLSCSLASLCQRSLRSLAIAYTTARGSMDGTWQEHDGTDGQTDHYKVLNGALGPKL